MRCRRGDDFFFFRVAAVVFFLAAGFLGAVWLALEEVGAAASCAKRLQPLASSARIKTEISCRRRSTTLLYLSPKIGAHDGNVILRKAGDKFAAEIIGAGCRRVPVSLGVGGATFLDVFFQTVVQV